MVRTTVSTRISQEWRSRLEAIAVAEGVPLAELLQGIIAEYLKESRCDRVSDLERRVSDLERKLRLLAS